MVFSHRACGFAAGAALIPVYGWDFSKSYSLPRYGVVNTKSRPGRARPPMPRELAPRLGRLPARGGRAVVFERDVEPDPVSRDLAVLDGQVLPHHLGDAQVAQSLGRGLDGALRGRLPGLAAGPHQLGHPVDAVGHGCLLYQWAEWTLVSRHCRAPELPQVGQHLGDLLGQRHRAFAAQVDDLLRDAQLEVLRGQLEQLAAILAVP